MALNNPILYNAALAGVFAGASSGVNPAASAQNIALQDEILAAAEAIAAAVDALIAADNTITTAGSTTAPTTGPIQNAQTSKSGLLRAIAENAVSGQVFTAAPTGGALSALAAGIAQNYGVASAAFSTI
jgi:hypothetical protein